MLLLFLGRQILEFIADDGDGDEDCLPIATTEFGGNPGSPGFRHRKYVILVCYNHAVTPLFIQLLQHSAWCEPRPLHSTTRVPTTLLDRTSILNLLCSELHIIILTAVSQTRCMHLVYGSGYRTTL